MKTRKLITIFGGSGFVGHHLTAKLSRLGYNVQVVTRHPQRHGDLQVSPTATVVRAKSMGAEDIAELIAGSSAVVNLIGVLNASNRGFEQAHVVAAKSIAEACRKAGVTRMLHMSALNADANTGSSNYLTSKGAGEDAVHAVDGVAVTSFRPSIIFGPGDGFFNRFAKLMKLSPGVLPLACAKARFAPVYVNDVTEAFYRALNSPETEGQRYNLCGPTEYSLKELVRYTADIADIGCLVVGLGKGLSWMQALMLNWAPGRPFTLDTYRSLQTDSVCGGAFPEVFGITPKAVEAIVPTYIGEMNNPFRYDEYRSEAHR
jgi:NADH dehydrogenase